MRTMQQRIGAVDPAVLAGMRRGIEKEGLRALPTGQLALTPHPDTLGSALTHRCITTDFSESQIELITGVHADVDDCLHELAEIHQFVFNSLQTQGPEMLWVSSMPCRLPTDETIPLARYGSSNIGRAKSIYRMGLGHRYGRRMQTISGVHYNWSMPGITSEQYFSLIRNFRRHAFVLMYLFGASPALAPCFVQGREHGLQRLSDDTLYLPDATTLRMGRLGYQSDAQSTLAVSYNGLSGYADSLCDALTRPYPAYETVGIRNPGGDYNQLASTLLQIENEFYGTIRPKRTVRTGERPLHALRERGVEYVEVRLMDLDPFAPAGIEASTMRLIDIFLMHCLLADSPPDTPEEIACIRRNQHLAAERGRAADVQLERGGEGTRVALRDWGAEILAQCTSIAEALDAAGGGDAYQRALDQAQASMRDPSLTPSARVLREMEALHDNSFAAFALHQSQQARDQLLRRPWTAVRQADFEQLAKESLAQQVAIETADTLPFEAWRQQYVSMDSCCV